MVRKTIVLLANSRKHAERCLAGIEWDEAEKKWAGWIRPVSAREGEGLNERERFYDGGIEPAVLDVIDVPLIRANPHSLQTENWLVSAPDYWRKLGVLSWLEASQLAENEGDLWVNGFRTYNGFNDEIPEEMTKGFNRSIRMIRVPMVTIHVVDGYVQGTKKVYAEFNMGLTKYRLSLTDSIYEPRFKAGQARTVIVGESLLSISISEPFKKNEKSTCRYKLVAAMIPRNAI